ncbi:hypothetical protein TRFO_16262 [Tritrichomonas foetus]|uniref:Uncharacterized protein n=1 Tax=Tritrichomonas foetus TaxID=1144522 RepID=A0A1J4KVG7_9EUKA|nr:hypothetical protein TRFO_16262 [Tritrichomonas foetus]|eukprot:OHT13509.1 hypothetical protein TRFO_16262 [Tritrichomonas foetus]
MDIEEEVELINQEFDKDESPSEPLKKVMFYLAIIHKIIDYNFPENFVNYMNPYFNNPDEINELILLAKLLNPEYLKELGIIRIYRNDSDLENDFEIVELETDTRAFDLFPFVKVNVIHNLKIKSNWADDIYYKPIQLLIDDHTKSQDDEIVKEEVKLKRNIFFYLIILCIIGLWAFGIISLKTSFDLKDLPEFIEMNTTEHYKLAQAALTMSAISGSYTMIFVVIIIAFSCKIRRTGLNCINVFLFILFCIMTELLTIAAEVVITIAVFIENQIPQYYNTINTCIAMNTCIIIDYVLIVLFYIKK